MNDDQTLLDERLRLTRAVCTEIEGAAGNLQSDRVRRAAGNLWTWLDGRFAAEMGTRSKGGLDAMSIPFGGRGQMRELYAAAAVCDALSVYYSADTFREMERDAEDVARQLAHWRDETAYVSGQD